MALIKPCCCISNRIATLLCLFFFWITSILCVVYFAIVIWKSNSLSYEYYSNLFDWLFQLVIYSATIISFIIKKPRLSLLYLALAVSILLVIQSFSVIIAYFSSVVRIKHDLVLLLIWQVFSTYSVWVFYCYIPELKEKRVGGGIVLNRVDDTEANFSNT